MRTADRAYITTLAVKTHYNLIVLAVVQEADHLRIRVFLPLRALDGSHFYPVCTSRDGKSALRHSGGCGAGVFVKNVKTFSKLSEDLQSPRGDLTRGALPPSSINQSRKRRGALTAVRCGSSSSSPA